MSIPLHPPCGGRGAKNLPRTLRVLPRFKTSVFIGLRASRAAPIFNRSFESASVELCHPKGDKVPLVRGDTP